MKTITNKSITINDSTNDLEESTRATKVLRLTRTSRATHSNRYEARKTRYTMNGHMVIEPNGPIRLYEPTYRLESQNPFDIEHVNFLVRNCTLQNIENYFKKYNAMNATQFSNELSHEIKMRIKLLNYDRYRIIVIVNVVEKCHQTVNWQIGLFWQNSHDLWTSFRHETPSFHINVIALGIYWN